VRTPRIDARGLIGYHAAMHHPDAFSLHPQLAADCFQVGQFSLCLLLLLNDSHYPWFILVPRRPDLSELHQLTEADRIHLWRESADLSRAMTTAFRPDKLNIAAIGNLVPQLHLHHIARYRDDPVWPRPVWGALPALPYSTGAERQPIAAVCGLLAGAFTPIG
jgi:diadenosine tetraphosphate (Ap4A) HIT family hydrolase